MPDLSFLKPSTDLQYIGLLLLVGFFGSLILRRKPKLTEKALNKVLGEEEPKTEAGHVCHQEPMLEQIVKEIAKVQESQERMAEIHSSIQASLHRYDARLTNTERGLDRVADLVNQVLFKLAERK